MEVGDAVVGNVYGFMVAGTAYEFHGCWTRM